MMRNPDVLKQAERLAQETGLDFAPGLFFHALHRGPHGRRKSGGGDDFWQFRDYRQGDSARQIDWKKTAKSGEAFIREREESVPQTIVFHRDMNPSMDYASQRKGMRKSDYADVLWLALAHMAIKSGERVSVGDDPSPVSRVDNLPDAYHSQQRRPARMAAAGHGKAMVMISDFCKPAADIGCEIGDMAARRMSGLVICLSDPAEVSFPFSGHVVLHDDGGVAIDLPAAESVRTEYETRFRAHIDAIRAQAVAGGFVFVHLVTDTPLPQAMRQIILSMTGDAA